MDKLNKRFFCSFADRRMDSSLKRIKNQALNLNFFDEIIVVNENYLDKDFIKTHKELLKKETLGFGYWIWKPQLILQVLNKMNDNDLLLYTDAGCHLNIHGLTRLEEYFSITKESEHGILLAELESYRLERIWTKGDIFEHFNCRNMSNIINTPQIQAGFIVLKKCEKSIKLIKKWLKTMENINLIDDSPSLSPNFHDFIEHRHDQSILSVLCKKFGCELISGKEIYSTNWESLIEYPIWAKRDKKYNANLIQKLLHFFKKRYK
ncbi:MAG: hypothetical protein RIQ61_1455 [Bacteroidota bacterium]|jgi:hypothetical protein